MAGFLGQLLAGGSPGDITRFPTVIPGSERPTTDFDRLNFAANRPPLIGREGRVFRPGEFIRPEDQPGFPQPQLPQPTPGGKSGGIGALLSQLLGQGQPSAPPGTINPIGSSTAQSSVTPGTVPTQPVGIPISSRPVNPIGGFTPAQPRLPRFRTGITDTIRFGGDFPKPPSPLNPGFIPPNPNFPLPPHLVRAFDAINRFQQPTTAPVQPNPITAAPAVPQQQGFTFNVSAPDAIGIGVPEGFSGTLPPHIQRALDSLRGFGGPPAPPNPNIGIVRPPGVNPIIPNTGFPLPPHLQRAQDAIQRFQQPLAPAVPQQPRAIAAPSPPHTIVAPQQPRFQSVQPRQPTTAPVQPNPIGTVSRQPQTINRFASLFNR